MGDASEERRGLVATRVVQVVAASVIAWAVVLGGAWIWSAGTDQAIRDILPRLCVAAGGVALVGLAFGMPSVRWPGRTTDAADPSAGAKPERAPWRDAFAWISVALSVQLLFVGFFVVP